MVNGKIYVMISYRNFVLDLIRGPKRRRTKFPPPLFCDAHREDKERTSLPPLSHPAVYTYNYECRIIRLITRGLFVGDLFLVTITIEKMFSACKNIMQSIQVLKPKHIGHYGNIGTRGVFVISRVTSIKGYIFDFFFSNVIFVGRSIKGQRLKRPFE